ncbi:MAG: helix-turn-helix domain-containing protein [Pseudomonadales bacterium]|nr:helix-turn-helix domain-containing protein [Pseudomonadales bacterium]
MLEPCSRLVSYNPEQHLDFHLNGRVKVLGYASPLGEKSCRQTKQGFIQIKNNRTMTLHEGNLINNWLILSIRANTSSPVLVNGNHLEKPQTVCISVGGTKSNYIMTPGAIVYTVGIHKQLIDEDLRTNLLQLNIPQAQRILEISHNLRLKLIKRIEMLMRTEMSQREFHMELVDLLTTLLSATSLQPEYTFNTSRSRVVQRATSVIANEDPRLLTPALVAKKSFASIRTLEYAFKQVLLMTPKQYIDFYRINLLREKILDNPNMEIMYLGNEVGLSHLGNLSKNYKALYGETPSTTRRSSSAL